jgi:protein-ribulosamine 3-kinase
MNLSQKTKFEIEISLNNKIVKTENLAGGSINNAFKITDSKGNVHFLKINTSTPPDMFIKEAHGLNELQKAEAIKIPRAIVYSDKFIVTEFISLGNKSKNFFEKFGRNFAQLHKFRGKFFGFYEDNYIGSNPQKNIPENNESLDWTAFYFRNRLLFQFKLAEKNGYATDELRKYFSKLENKIEVILKDSTEKPSLLHGDLWSGNFLVDENGDACIIDPAVYYGNREADLAMTKLFGGYTDEFYKSYSEVYPMKDGWEFRENIYKLYHVINHLNLFGLGYYSQALSLIKYYL